MRKTGIILIVLFALVSSAVIAAGMPTGSFLNSPVGSVGQLTQQVIDDPIVAARYAKHFSTSRNAVVEYFQENLKAGRLTSDLECTVYEIAGRTDAVATQRVLPKGTYVFVAADGRPMLEVSSGNPLTNAMPLRAMNSDRRVPTDSAVKTSVASDNVTTKVLGAPAAEVGASSTAVIVGSTDPSAIVAAAAVDPSVEIVQSMPVGGKETTSVGKSGSTALLGVAALVGGLAMAGGGGGGASSRSQPDSSPSPVPEPAAMAMVLAGGMGMVLSRIRRR